MTLNCKLIRRSLNRETDQSFHDDFTIKKKNIFNNLFSDNYFIQFTQKKIVEEFEKKNK